jgi:hypothetical protein
MSALDSRVIQMARSRKAAKNAKIDLRALRGIAAPCSLEPARYTRRRSSRHRRLVPITGCF